MEHTNLQKKLRKKILELNYPVGGGHIGCALSCIDILIAIVKYKSPDDSFILSKGHAGSALYALLNSMGEISDEELSTFYKNATSLPAHPAANKFASIPFATGSLGHGFPLAAGVAKANKIKKSNAISYALLSDGETNEGTTWEAAHFAVANQLDNLVIIVDKNGLQGFGNLTDILGDTASGKVWAAIGFDVNEIDGHDIDGIIKLNKILTNNKNGKPKLIIANTIKGKGISFMENKLEWHYLSLNEAQYNNAMDCLETEYNS